MTAAVAIVEGGDVVVGIDSCTTSPGDMSVDNVEKRPIVFSLSGHPDLVLLFAGRSAIDSEVAYDWKPPTPEDIDPMRFLRTCAVSLREHFSTEPLWSLSKEDDLLDGHWIAAWCGVAVEISSDFGVLRPRSGEVAIGTGRDFVLGALAATKGKPAKDRALVGLEAAAQFQQDVAPPFTIQFVAGR